MAEDWFATNAPTEDWFAAQAPPPPSPKAALALAAAGQAIPVAAKYVTTFAQSPTAAKVGGAIARHATTAAEVARGLVTASPTDILAAPKAGWFAGKGGYWLTKAAQGVSGPVGAALEKVAPYAQTLLTLAGAQGINDLAQMAEPNRKDIGFLGLGASVPKSELIASAREHGAEWVNNGVKNGLNPAQAAARVADGDPEIFGAIMTSYMRSRQVK